MSSFGAMMANLVERVVLQMCLLLRETVFFSQSMHGLCSISQGIPKTT